MKKFTLVIIALIFLLAISVAAGEDTGNAKANVDFKVRASDVGDSLEIHVSLPNDATGTVKYSVDGKSYTVNVVNGDAKLTVPNPGAGNHVIKAQYSGDDKYLGANTQTAVSVKEPATPQTANASGAPDNASDIISNSSAANGTVIDNTTDNTTNNSTPSDNSSTNHSTNKTPVNKNPPQKPKPKPHSNLPRAGLPVALVIVALAAVFVLRKYKF